MCAMASIAWHFCLWLPLQPGLWSPPPLYPRPLHELLHFHQTGQGVLTLCCGPGSVPWNLLVHVLFCCAPSTAKGFSSWRSTWILVKCLLESQCFHPMAGKNKFQLPCTRPNADFILASYSLTQDLVESSCWVMKAYCRCLLIHDLWVSRFSV